MMKLSSLELVRGINVRLVANRNDIEEIEQGNFTLLIAGTHVLQRSEILKRRIKDELISFYTAERDLIWNELKRLGVEVDV